MKSKALLVFSALLIIVVACWASTKIQGAAIQYSTIDSTTIGATTPASAVVTSLTLSGATGNKCVYTNGSGALTEAAGTCSGRLQIASTTGCTTSSSAGATCTNTVTWPTSFGDTSYIAVCQGYGFNGAPYVAAMSSLSATSIQVITSNGQGSQAVNSNFNQIYCMAYHS